MTFSILIPAYNVSKYIKKCLESVIQQTYVDWEIILFDDGSTDGTVDIIKQYMKKDIRIKAFFGKRNQGVATIRNLLLEEASGDYIIFLDSDDWWKDKKGLEKIAANSQENNMDIIVFQHEAIRKDGMREFRDNNTRFLEKTYIYTGEEYLKAVLGKRFTYQWLPFLYAFKKNLWTENDIKFNPNAYAFEDAEVLYKVILIASKIVVLHEVIYQYRIEREGSLTQPTKMLAYSMLKFSSKAIKEVNIMNINSEIKALLCDNFTCQYFGALYAINYFSESDAKDILALLKKEKSIMSYVRTRKYVFLARIINLLGLRITSKVWFIYANRKQQYIRIIHKFK